MKIVSKSLLRGILADIADGTPPAGKLSGLHVGLLTSPVGSITPETVRADVTEAAYTGYARQAVGTWSAVYDDANGRCNLEAPTQLYQPSDAAVPENITGVAYFDASTAGNLVGVDPFDTPYPLPDQFSGLPIVPHASLPFTLDMGSAVEVA
jgi:hypothetical protein